MIDRQQFRDAMARLGAAVNVVTTVTPDGPVGFTASAVCSVTDQPPTMLLCMNRGSVLNEAFKAAGVLCINTLTPEQEALSSLFGGAEGLTMPERFEQGTWTTLVTGAPVLEGAVVSVDCRIAQVTEIGTHSVMFCEALACKLGVAEQGLIYFSRGYHTVGV